MGMTAKEITVAFYGRRFAREEWRYQIDEAGLDAFLAGLDADLSRFGIRVGVSREEDFVIDIRGYADLLNSVRIRSPKDGIGNLCLGHIIGPSPERNLLEDIRRGVNRVAFAPETVEPEGSNKVVCHNCGCGC